MGNEESSFSLSNSEVLLPLEPLHLRYCGLKGDTHFVPLDDFVLSLDGFRQFIKISVTAYIQKKLTLSTIDSPQELVTRIGPLKPGSLDVTLRLILITAVGGVIAMKADRAITIQNAKSLFHWFKKLYDFLIDVKKQYKTKEEAARDLEALAREEGLDVDEEYPESQRFVGKIDEALRGATVPVDEAADSISLCNSQMDIEIDRSARRAIKSPFIMESRSDDYFTAEVQVRELNLDTGHTRLEVIRSDDENFESKMDRCYIRDPVLKEPGNMYSNSLDKHVGIDVYVCRSVDKANGSTKEWKITSQAPEASMPLFDVAGH